MLIFPANLVEGEKLSDSIFSFGMKLEHLFQKKIKCPYFKQPMQTLNLR